MAEVRESFLDYRKRMEKIELYRAWEVENKKTFYRPKPRGSTIRSNPYWEEMPVDARLLTNIRRYDLPALGDED